MIISIPSVVVLTAFFISLWGGSIRFNTPMLFALSFLPMFGIGGLTGLPPGVAASDIYLHDTYYVIGHFLYVVAPGTLFAHYAGIYYWFPKMTGRKLHEGMGKLHFLSFILAIDGIFMPMFIQGLAGLSRRMYDGGQQYAHASDITHWNRYDYICFYTWTCSNTIYTKYAITLSSKKSEDRNPWKSTTIEWSAPSPLFHMLILNQLVKFRGPYEYSVPDKEEDFYPQTAPWASIPYIVEERPDTGLNNSKLGVWIFLASEVMLFGGLFSAYVFLRLAAPEGDFDYWGSKLNVPMATLNTMLLITSSVTMVIGWAS